ncbi:MAG: hypothetical protein EBR83_10675, partial [Verrucomicrobia bacterium]|nr:hypothetical protein [Verrucomicrobiota bacterium]
CLLLGTSTLMLAQALPKNPERVIAERILELDIDRIEGGANGQPITLSDLRRQLKPFVAEIRQGKSDGDFNKAIEELAHNILEDMINRQLAIAEFKTSSGKVPAFYIESDIEDSIRRDFGGDRNRFVAYLRAQGLTPMSYRKLIEDRITFEYIRGQISRTALEVGPGKLQAYYNTHQAEFSRKESVQFRQITLMQGASETFAEGKARAEAWAAETVSLPCFPEITDDEIVNYGYNLADKFKFETGKVKEQALAKRAEIEKIIRQDRAVTGLAGQVSDELAEKFPTDATKADNAGFAKWLQERGAVVKTLPAFDAGSAPTVEKVPAEALRAAGELTEKEWRTEVYRTEDAVVFLTLVKRTESRLPDFKEVAKQATDNWRDGERQRLLKAELLKLSQGLQADAAAGKSFAESAKARGLKLTSP